MSGSGGPSPAEQHLGDRLAALVDGELGHDARERVLAHLATCGKCKAEADAQRRLKSVFAQALSPGPSEGLLARLQQLPGGDPDGPGSRLGNGTFGRGEFVRGDGAFRYVPSDDHLGGAMAAVAAPSRARGFRVQEPERGVPQRRRLAFAAAGAVSLAAFALGGALPLEAAVDVPGPRAEGSGTAVTPLGARPAAGSGVFSGGAEGPTTREPGPGPGPPPATPRALPRRARCPCSRRARAALGRGAGVQPRARPFRTLAADSRHGPGGGFPLRPVVRLEWQRPGKSCAAVAAAPGADAAAARLAGPHRPGRLRPALTGLCASPPGTG
ncbi:zf-HC2 domain-containing protein [Streptomyces noursei]|nr:zf-HC2 domain-containing protein [Streptomyces noursei]